MAYLQRIPLINPNDDLDCIAEWLKSEDEYVKKGDTIAIIETSKAVVEIEAECDGYLVPLYKIGENIKVGQVFVIIKKYKEEDIKNILNELMEESKINKLGDYSKKEKKRKWTKKAEILAKRYGVEIDKIPSNGVIREADIKSIIEKENNVKVKDFVEDIYPGNRQKRILIIGGGRGAIQVIDVILRKRDYKIVGILDDNSKLIGKTIFGYPILGTISEILKMWKDKLFDVLIISFSNDLNKRAEVYEKYSKLGISFANVIDPNVSIHSNVAIGEGNLIMSFCRISSCSIIGNNNFFSAYVNIEHHNKVGNNCTFGPGVFTSSRVSVEDNVKFGTGIFIEPGVNIGENSIIASGSILTGNIPARSIVKSIINYKIRKI